MKLSNYILNSSYATLAEIDSAEITLTIPANFTANAVRETVIYSPYKNALFRYTITGGDNPRTMDGISTITRKRSGINVLYVVTVYRVDDTHIALACMTTDGYSVTGTSPNNLKAKVHFFESPFEA